MHTSGQSKTMPRSPQTASGRKTTRRRATSNAHYSATAFDTDSETDMHDNDDLPRRTSIATPQSTLVRSPLQRSQSTRPSPVHRQHSDNQSTSHESLSSESHLTLADEDLTTVITTTIMKTPPIGPPAQNTYQQKIRIDDETNNNNIHNNMAAGESDDEEEDDADVEEWNELTELLEEIDGDHQSGGRHEIEDSRIIQMWNWARRFTVNLLLISLVLVPGLICQFAYPGQCMIYGTGFLYYSIMFTVLIFGFFFADALVMILMLIVKNTPVLGSLFLYYIKNISSPLKWTIVSLIFQVTWNAFFLNTPLYQRFLFNDSNSLSIGSFVQSLITCFTVTAIGFLLKALLMRFFAVGFHRGAYYGRIRNALLVEYVLTKMLTGTRQARTMPAMRAFANKLSSVRQFVSAVRPVQSMNDLQQHVRKPSITDANIAITYEDDNNGDGGANGTQNPKKSNSGGIQGWLHRNRPKETFMLDSLPVTKNELLARSPISNYKLAGFVEFIKRNDFSFQHGVYRKAIERWERNKLGATESTELNQITIGSLRDSEGLMEIIDLQQQQQQHKRQTHSAYRRSNTAVHPPSYQMNPLSNGAAMADDTTINLEVDSLTPAQCTRMLASYIFERLHQPGSDEVTVDDFAQRMDAEISVQAFALFDGNWDGALAENEIYTTLLKIARDRKALKSALNDAETAIDKLDSAVTGFCMLVLFVSYFIIFGTDPNKVLLTLSSFLLAIAFAVGNSAKTLLESIIFIFVTHPFDIGDRVIIDKVVYTVVKMSLLTTHLKRFDNAVHYFSNSLLSTKPILNLRRSPDQFDIVTLNVALDTPTEKLRKLEMKIGGFLNRHSSHYYRKFEVEYRDMIGLNWLEVRVWIQHRCNFQNTRRFRERRGRVLIVLKRLCERLDIRCELPVQKIEQLISTTTAATSANCVGGVGDYVYQQPAVDGDNGEIGDAQPHGGRVMSAMMNSSDSLRTRFQTRPKNY